MENDVFFSKETKIINYAKLVDIDKVFISNREEFESRSCCNLIMPDGSVCPFIL